MGAEIAVSRWTTSQPQNARDAARRAHYAHDKTAAATPRYATTRRRPKPRLNRPAAPQQAKPSRTPAPKVSLGGNDSVELFFDAAETPRVTQTEVKEFACTPHAPRVSTTPILATPDERLLTNAAAEEALTAAWIAAQTAEIEALRALVRRQRHEKEALIANGAGPYATSVQRAARGRLWNHGRRYFNRQLRAAGEALRLPLVRTLRHEQSRLSGLRRRVDGRKVVEDGAETAQGDRRAGVDDLASQHLFGSIVAARAEAKLRSKTKMLLRGPGGPARGEIAHG